MKKNETRLSKHERILKDIRRKLKIADNATMQERLVTAHHFAQKHPEYSVRAICAAANVDQGTYRHFVKTGATGDNGRIAHRQIIYKAISERLAESGSQIGISEMVGYLSARNIKSSPRIVSEIYNELGIATSPYSIVAVEKFLAHPQIQNALRNLETAVMNEDS